MPRSPTIFEKNEFFIKRALFPVKSKLSAAELCYKSWKNYLFHSRAYKDKWVLSLDYYRANNTHINNDMWTWALLVPVAYRKLFS